MNNAIELVSPTYVITAVKRKTRAKVFEDWRVGDEIRFSTEMVPKAGASGGGVYASYFAAENLTQGTVAYKSQTEMTGMFSDWRGIFEIQPKEGAN